MNRIYSGLAAVAFGALAVYTGGNAVKLDRELTRVQAKPHELKVEAANTDYEYSNSLRRNSGLLYTAAFLSGIAGFVLSLKATNNPNQREYRFPGSIDEYPEQS